MINVIFKSIHIENFLSVGKSPLIIDFNKGMNVITGFNKDENDIKNGVGKSLVLDALYFCIFGNTIRKLSKQSFIVNRKIGKNCLVHLDFDIISSNGNKEMYVIERRLAPQSIKIWKNGNIWIGDATWQSIAYVSRYVTKKLYGAEADYYTTFNLVPEFLVCSRKPGIGRAYYEDHKDDLFEKSKYYFPMGNGVGSACPSRYFSNLFEADFDPQLVEDRKTALKEQFEARKALKLERTTYNKISISHLIPFQIFDLFFFIIFLSHKVVKIL